MSQYGTNKLNGSGTTINLTNGSQAVEGVDTEFLTEVAVGDILVKETDNNGLWFMVGSITDDTNLILAANYTGDTAADVDYIIHRDFSPGLSLALITSQDLGAVALLNRNNLLLEADMVRTVGDYTITGDWTFTGSMSTSVATGDYAQFTSSQVATDSVMR